MTLFTPGPIAMDPETIAIAGTQTQYFRTPEFSKIMLECTEMLKTAMDAPADSRLIFLTASGTGAMEASVMNLFTERDKLLIIAGGTFGKRFKRIAEIYRIPAEIISLEWNACFIMQENSTMEVWWGGGGIYFQESVSVMECRLTLKDFDSVIH